jgi:hypothetical protein
MEARSRQLVTQDDEGESAFMVELPLLVEACLQVLEVLSKVDFDLLSELIGWYKPPLYITLRHGGLSIVHIYVCVVVSSEPKLKDFLDSLLVLNGTVQSAVDIYFRSVCVGSATAKITHLFLYKNLILNFK